MSAFESLKCKIHFRGDVSFKEQSFDYIGGNWKDMLVDPDLMTWSIFGEFCVENGVDGEVVDVWCKLPHEDISSARSMGKDKDGGIRELCREAVIGGEVDIYIDNGVSIPVPVPDEDVADEEDEEEADEPDQHGEQRTNEQQDDGVDPVEEGRHDDPRFSAFFEEINNNDRPAGDEAAGGDEAAVGDEPAGVNEAASDVEEEVGDEDEFERQCFDAQRPDHVLDTMHQRGGSKLKASLLQLFLKVKQENNLSIQVLHHLVLDVLVGVFLELKMVKQKVVSELVVKFVAKDQMKLLNRLFSLCLHGLTKSLMFGNKKKLS